MPTKFPFFLLAVLILIGLITSVSAVQPVIVNKTYVLEPAGTTPFNIWAGSIIMGVILFLLSLGKFPHGEEGIVSIISWIPLGFAMFTSMAVDRITSTGYAADTSGTPILIEMHTVGSYYDIAIVLLVLLLVAFGNTYRIYANQAQGTGFSRGIEG